MNYEKIYFKIMERGMERDETNLDYLERHHMVPRCLGGTNEDWNLVNLSLREHFVAHQLLVKMFPENRKLIYAANMMSGRNSKQYEWVRKKFIANHPLKCPELRERIRKLNTGVVFTEERKRKISEKQKEVWARKEDKRSPSKGCKWSDESKKRLSESISGEKNPFYGKKHDDETKDRMRKNHWKKCKWKLVSPEGVEYNFEGGISRFCNEHNLPVDTVKSKANKGVVQLNKSGKITDKRKRLVGWEIFKYAI